MQLSMRHCYQKAAHKQFRWLCVSPYLLLSLLTAGISLPLAVSLMNSESIQANFNRNDTSPSKHYSFRDLVQSYTSRIIFKELFGKEASYTQNALLTKYSNKYLYDVSQRETLLKFKTSYLHYQTKINHFFSFNFYHSSSISAFSSQLFSTHPKRVLFSTLSWISHLFAIDSATLSYN